MTWSSDQLAAFDTDEMHIAGRRADGTLRTPRIVWMVSVGDDLYTRSVNGPDAAWFRGTRATGEGHVSAGRVDADVTFHDVDAADPINDALDDAYRAKYRRYSGPVASITSPLARTATLRVSPR